MSNKFNYKEIKTQKDMGKEEFDKFIDSLSDEDFDAYLDALNLRKMHDVMALINAGEKTYVDDHNGDTRKLEAYVALSSGYVCPVFINCLCCLNRLYVGKDGNIHLSTSSIAGNFGTNYRNVSPDATPEEKIASGVEFYNKIQNDANEKYDLHYAVITEYKVL